MKGLQSPMYYTEFEPEPELKPWIAAYWNFRVEPDAGEIEHWIPLTGGVMLACPHGAPAVISGPRVEPFATRVRGGDLLWGAHFWPGAAVSLLGPRSRRLRNEHRLAQQVLDPEWVAKLERALEQESDQASAALSLNTAFSQLLAGASPLDESVMTVVFRLIAVDGNRAVAELAASVHLSPRQFRRRFRGATELTPKEFARLQRVRSAAVDSVYTNGARWVDVAAEHGYADQPHLVSEFRRILGLTPTAFGDHMQRIQHGRILR